jgi:hypothetical protein
MRLAEFLAGQADTPGPVAAVTRGGFTVDPLRNLLGDDAVRVAPVMAAGIPPCAWFLFTPAPASAPAPAQRRQ